MIPYYAIINYINILIIPEHIVNIIIFTVFIIVKEGINSWEL